MSPRKWVDLSISDFFGKRKKIKTQHLINLMIDNKYENNAIIDSTLHFINEVLIHNSSKKQYINSIWKYRVKKEIINRIKK